MFHVLYRHYLIQAVANLISPRVSHKGLVATPLLWLVQQQVFSRPMKVGRSKKRTARRRGLNGYSGV